MRIFFVRHGHPNYERDCLTELGVKHAVAAALRLKDEGIEQIFSSTCGRAYETASHLAEALQLPIVPFDFMREITWGGMDGEELPLNGHPWDTAERMVAEGKPIMDPGWATGEIFRRNSVVTCIENIARHTDEWLQNLGYTREGHYYRVTGTPPGTVAAFGHGGASTAILSHLLNLPFPLVCTTMGPDYTGITIVTLPDTPGALVTPRIAMLNDAKHIRGMTVKNYFGN